MARGVFRLIPLFVLVLFLMAPSKAEARRGIVLITHGESVSDLGEIASEHQQEVREGTGNPSVTNVGYVYSAFGVFWCNIWTWGGNFCVYTDDECWILEAEEAARLMGKTSISKPFFYRFPPGLMIIVGLLTAWGVSSWRTNSANKELQSKLQTTADDPRYKRALEIFQQHLERAEAAAATAEGGEEAAEAEADEDNSEAAFEAAVKHLVDSGIEREEAEQNFGLLVMAIVHSNQSE